MDWSVVWAALGAGGGGSALTGYVTYKVTDRQVRSAEGVAEAQRAHELSLAEEARRQERLLDAYVSVQRHVAHWSRAVEWKLRDMSYQYDPPLVEPSPDSIDYASEALASLVASGEVGSLVRDFNRKLLAYGTQLRGYEEAVKWVQSHDSGPDQPAVSAAARAHEVTVASGRGVLAIAVALVKQMRRELGTLGELPPDDDPIPGSRPGVPEVG